MASVQHWQPDNKKYDHKHSRTDIYNPEFTPTVEAKGNKEADLFTQNLDKWSDFTSWARFFPDLWYDLITPEKGSIRLDLDQRVFLRSLARFLSVYGVFPRGYGKTFVEDLGMYHAAIWFPDIDLSMTAQTRENASKLMDEKHREIIKYYPLMSNEIRKASFTKDSAEVLFTSGGEISVLANHQSSKGSRRKRLSIEESALLNDELFQDVLEPIPNIPRRTIGKLAEINPEEINGSIHFFTTSGFRNSSEFDRNLRMVDEMAELKGKLVLGADWTLACEYGRGETKSQLLEKKERLSPIFFQMNYCSKWVGAAQDALVDINKFLNLRVIGKPELKSDGKSEYYCSMDVSRSNKNSNNQSSIVVIKVKRNSEQRISKYQVVNLVNLPNGLNFTGQAIAYKRIKNAYNCKIAVLDANTIGMGLLDELLKEQTDPMTNETLECWDTINTDDKPDMNNAKKCLYALHSQGTNTEIIVNFIDMVESEKLQLLEKNTTNNYDFDDSDYLKNVIIPHMQTDLLVEEVANLKIKQLSGGKLTTEQVTKRVDRDRYSALAYGLWYIKNFEDKIIVKNIIDWSNAPQCVSSVSY